MEGFTLYLLKFKMSAAQLGINKSETSNRLSLESSLMLTKFANCILNKFAYL